MSIVKTMKGKSLDIGAIMAQNQDVVAIGNAKMNARGDVLGEGGKVVKSSAAISAEYNANNPKAVKRVSLADLTPEKMLSPADAMAEFKKKADAARQKLIEEGDDFEDVQSSSSIQEAAVVGDQPEPVRKRRLVDK